MTKLRYPLVIQPIIEEHFEELDFLLEQRESVLFAPDWNLGELAELEERAEAHLDGLRLAEGHAVDIARPALAGAEPFAASAATLVFMESGHPELEAEVIRALECAPGPECRDGIRIALRRSRIDSVRDALLDLAARPDADVAAAAADVLTFRGISVPDLDGLVQAEEPATRALAHRALGRQGALTDSAMLLAALDDESPAVRRAALEGAAMSGMQGLEDLCLTASHRREAPNLEALAFLGIFRSQAVAERLQSGVQQPSQIAAAVEGLGALGNPGAIPLLIQLMAEGQDQPLEAAAAFTRLTGFDDLFLAEPATPESGLADDEEKDDDEADSDDPPVMPNADLADAWWSDNRERFEPSGTWQNGIEVSEIIDSPAFDSLPLQIRRDLFLSARASGRRDTPVVGL
jgi:uncharacterized protein (TIGR02270 family)